MTNFDMIFIHIILTVNLNAHALHSVYIYIENNNDQSCASFGIIDTCFKNGKLICNTKTYVILLPN